MKKKKIIFIVVFISSFLSLKAGHEFCVGKPNTAFQPNESISYDVFYTLAGVYVFAGNATFSCYLEKYNSKPVYHLIGSGVSNKFFDDYYIVRDKYESYIDTATLQPFKFVRNVLEGEYKKFENVSFDQKNNKATSTNGTFNVPNCIQDVLSAVYYARNLNFDTLKVDAKIPFSMFIDDEVHNLYIRYLGKEKIKTKYGQFNAIKFRPLLINGTLFTGGEKMNVWVSDDANHIPLRIESPIVVGNVKVDMMKYKNIRYPLTSLIKKN